MEDLVKARNISHWLHILLAFGFLPFQIYENVIFFLMVHFQACALSVVQQEDNTNLYFQGTLTQNYILGSGDFCNPLNIMYIKSPVFLVLFQNILFRVHRTLPKYTIITIIIRFGINKFG